MAGFSSTDQIVSAMTSGQSLRKDWAKNFVGTASATAVANEWHFMGKGGGNPPADALFDTGSALTFQPVSDTTANASSILHGGNVSPKYKHIISASAVSAAATVVPCTLALIDVIGYYRVTAVTTATEQATTNNLSAFSTFTADAGTDTITHSNINLMPYTKVQVSTTTTLPAGLSAATNYYVIKVTDTTCKLATSYANAVAGTQIDITDAGTGTHTINTLLPRYTNGAGVNAFFFNPQATALGAATPNLRLNYTNSEGTSSRATPTVYPVGKTAATNSHILHTGATAAGKYNYSVPLQGGDAGIQSIEGIRNESSYVSGMYSVILYKELLRLPLSTLGLAAERNLLNELPSLPRVYDGAALYWALGSGVATPINSAFSGHLDFVWN